MKKLILSAMMILLFPAAAWAHTGLISSVPASGETRQEPVKEITMEFSTTIEPISTFEVRNGEGDKIAVSDIQVQDGKMTGSFARPLPNGKYTVDWKIVGEDGHPVEGEFDFTVDAPPAQPENTANLPAPNGGEHAAADGTDNRASVSQPEPQPQSDKQTGTAITWVIVIGLLAVAIAVLFRAFRRQKK